MANALLNVIRQSIDFRNKDLEGEQWKPDHLLVMALYAFEDSLQVGVGLFLLLNQVEEEWRKRTFCGQAEYSQELVEAFDDALRLWLKPRDEIERLIALFKSQFGKVKHVEAFRECCAEAEGMLTPDSEFFGQPLVELQDQAIEDFRKGDTVEHGARE